MSEMIKRIGWILSGKEKKKIIALIFMMVIGSFLELMGVSLVLPLIEMVMKQGSDINLPVWQNRFFFCAGVLALVYLLKNLFLALMFYFIYRFVYQGSSDLSTRMLAFYMRQPYAFHLQRNVSVMQRTICQDVKGFYIVVRQLLQIVAEILICLVLVGFLFYTDVTMTLFLLVVLGGCVGAFLLAAKKLAKKLGREDMEYQTRINQWVMQAIGGIKEIRVLGREDFFVEQFGYFSKKSATTNRKQQFLLQLPRLVTESVCILAVITFLVIRVAGGADLLAMVPTLAVFVVAAFRLLPSVGKINGYVSELMFYRGCVDFIYEDLQSIRDDMEKERKAFAEGELTFADSVVVKNVTFHYDNSEKTVLKNVTVEIPKGKSVAFIGPSGAGKTTLADIVMGVLSPVSGEILVDGKNIQEYRKNWYSKIGYVPQNIYLSDDTIRNNVAFGIREESISEEKVWKALAKAQLEEFVKGLEKGLNTEIGERGVRLSGGQRQRIGIARALYHNPEILVLDEATSALDQDTESGVMEAIESLHGEKTMLIIAHRLTTIQKCDLVYEVSEQGVSRKGK